MKGLESQQHRHWTVGSSCQRPVQVEQGAATAAGRPYLLRPPPAPPRRQHLHGVGTSAHARKKPRSCRSAEATQQRWPHGTAEAGTHRAPCLRVAGQLLHLPVGFIAFMGTCCPGWPLTLNVTNLNSLSSCLRLPSAVMINLFFATPGLGSTGN